MSCDTVPAAANREYLLSLAGWMILYVGLIFLAFSLFAYQMADLVLSEFRDFGGVSHSVNRGDLGDPHFNVHPFGGP